VIDREQLTDEYPHWLRIWRAGVPTGGSGEGEDPETGLPTDDPGSVLPSTITILECPCDAQDAGESRPRLASGMPQLNADTQLYIPDEEQYVDDFLNVLPDDGFELIYPNGRSADGEILFVRVLDTSLLGKFR
jgi:hypothetical protein